MTPASSVDRRAFLVASGSALAGVALGAAEAPKAGRLRVALAGTGSRGSGTWG